MFGSREIATVHRTEIAIRLFFLTTVMMALHVGPAKAERPREASPTCRERVAESVCLVEPHRKRFTLKNIHQRTCLPGSSKYRDKIVQIFDRYPSRLKSVMCKLDRIFVEQRFWASGYAHPRQRAIGIHHRFLDNDTTLSEWATWKERQSLEMAELGPSIKAGQPVVLPIVIASQPRRRISAAEFIIAHELAHRIDVENKFTNNGRGEFARINWRGRGKHAKSTTLPMDWQTPCFYSCKKDKKLRLHDIANIYETLSTGSFVSLYATRNPAEDFADTFAHVVLSKQADLELRLTIGGQLISDLSSLSRSPLLKQKVSFVEAILDGSRPLRDRPRQEPRSSGATQSKDSNKEQLLGAEIIDRTKDDPDMQRQDRRNEGCVIERQDQTSGSECKAN